MGEGGGKGRGKERNTIAENTWGRVFELGNHTVGGGGQNLCEELLNKGCGKV